MPPKRARMVWRWRDKPDELHYGRYVDAEMLARTIEQANKDFPGLEHWSEPEDSSAEEADKSTDEAEEPE